MAKDARFPGFDLRLREAMRRAGYWYSDRDEPQVLRFCLECGHVSQYLYAYLRQNRAPDLARLRKLARDLRVSMAWLLLGDEGVADLRRFMEHRRYGHRRSTGGGAAEATPTRLRPTHT